MYDPLIKTLGTFLYEFEHNRLVNFEFCIYVYCKQNRHRSVSVCTQYERGLSKMFPRMRIKPVEHLCRQSQSEVACQSKRRACTECGRETEQTRALTDQFINELLDRCGEPSMVYFGAWILKYAVPRVDGAVYGAEA